MIWVLLVGILLVVFILAAGALLTWADAEDSDFTVEAHHFASQVEARRAVTLFSVRSQIAAARLGRELDQEFRAVDEVER